MMLNTDATSDVLHFYGAILEYNLNFCIFYRYISKLGKIRLNKLKFVQKKKSDIEIQPKSPDDCLMRMSKLQLQNYEKNY